MGALNGVHRTAHKRPEHTDIQHTNIKL